MSLLRTTAQRGHGPRTHPIIQRCTYQSKSTFLQHLASRALPSETLVPVGSVVRFNKCGRGAETAVAHLQNNRQAMVALRPFSRQH